RYDAGRGLWLRGDGTGLLSAMTAEASGVAVYGTQRAAALADFDEDGRIDLVVSQNAAETKLFHNETARPGLRIRLRGAGQNVAGIGSVIRLGFQGKPGPAREVRAGAGFGSQDSPVAVLGTQVAANQVHVRWPGGRSTTTDLPPGKREVTIDSSGALLESR